jgi:hypothetical protein
MGLGLNYSTREMGMVGVRWYQVARIGFAVLAIAAIIGQLMTSWDYPAFKVTNFFSFFTIQSNLLASIVLLIDATTQINSTRWEYMRGAVVTYMITVGIVYATLLAGLPDNLDLTEPWVNVVLHQLMPIAFVVDWMLVPSRQRLVMRRALVWILYPLAFCAYSLLRGPVVGWYPYPFLNPDETGGYPGVFAMVLGLGLGFAAITWLVVRLGNEARRQWSVSRNS